MPPITMPDNEATESPEEEASENEQCVPLASLAADGTPPAEGDEVTYTVKGKITRVDGDNAYVTATTINDQPVPEDEPKTSPEDDMMSKAMEADASPTTS